MSQFLDAAILSKLLPLVEAKAAFPVGTLQRWSSGLWQKVKHSKQSPGGKKPVDWAKLSNKFKLADPTAPKETYLPGTPLPPELAGFSYDPSENVFANGKKGHAEPDQDQGGEAAEPVEPLEVPEVGPLKPFKPDDEGGPELGKVQAPLSDRSPEAAAQDLAKKGPETPAEDAKDAAVAELQKDQPAPPETQNKPNQVLQGLGWGEVPGLPSKGQLDACETSYDYHLWGYQLLDAMQGPLKLAPTDGILASLAEFRGILEGNPSLSNDLDDRYGAGWFEKWTDAILKYKVQGLVPGQYQSMNATELKTKYPAFSSVISKTYGPGWADSFVKLMAGAPFGLVSAIWPQDAVAANPGQDIQDVGKSKSPTTPDPTLPLDAFVDQAIADHSNLWYLTLKDTNFTKAVLKGYGAYWYKKYFDLKSAGKGPYQASPLNTPIAPMPPLPALPVDGKAKDLPVADQPGLTLPAGLEADLLKDVSDLLGGQKPYYKSLDDIEQDKGSGTYQDLVSLYGKNWKSHFLKAKGEAEAKKDADFVTAVNKYLTNTHINDVEQVVSPFMVGQYGPDWKDQFKALAAAQGGTPAKQEVVPGSDAAIKQAMSLKAVHDELLDFTANKGLAAFWSTKTNINSVGGATMLADPLQIKDGTKADQELAAKFGADWKKGYLGNLKDLQVDVDTWLKAQGLESPFLLTGVEKQLLMDKFGKDFAYRYYQAVAASKGGIFGYANFFAAQVMDVVAEVMPANKLAGSKFNPSVWGSMYSDLIISKVKSAFPGYGSDWKHIYLNAMGVLGTPAAASGLPKGIETPAPIDTKLVDLIDNYLKVTGVSLDVLSQNNSAFATQAMSLGGPDWKQKYEKAKGLSGFGKSPVDSEGSSEQLPPAPKATDKYAYIKAKAGYPEKSIVDVVTKAVNEAPPGASNDKLQHLQADPEFVAAMKSTYGPKWLDTLKKHSTILDAPGKKQSPESKKAASAKANGVAAKSKDSLVPSIEAAAKAFYNHDPTLWKNKEEALEVLLQTPAFAAAMADKHGSEWKETYDAIQSGIPEASAPVAAHAGYVFPPWSELQDEGSAADLGGYNAKFRFRDSQGNKYMFKPVPDGKFKPSAAESVSNIQAIMFGDDGVEAYIPVKAGVSPTRGYGSLQPLQVGADGTLKNVELQSLTKEQLRQIMRERVLDWAISNSDSHADQFLKLMSGSLKGIDKEQAFYFLGKDELSVHYSPNELPPLYNALFNSYQKKQLDLDLEAVLPYISKIENTPDAVWAKAVEPYLAAKAPQGADRAALLKQILARKNSVRADFEGFFTKLKIARGDIQYGEKFQFDQSTFPKPLKVGELPYASTLSLVKSVPGKGLVSAQHVYQANGKDYLYTVHQDSTGFKVKPSYAHTAEGYSKVAQWVKPGYAPTKAILVKDDIGTLSDFHPDPAKTLAKKTGASLPLNGKISLAAEHLLDWLGSQHSTTGDKLHLRGDQIQGTGKGEGFRYFDFGKGDKLSLDFHPDAMSPAPYYNGFWGDWVGGKFKFEPQVLGKYVDAIEVVHDDDYAGTYKVLAHSLYKGDPSAQQKFLDAVVARKQNLRMDFEKFFTGLYKKKTGAEGVFTFKGGWKQGQNSVKVVETAVKAAEAMKSDQYGNMTVNDFKDSSGNTDPSKLVLKMPTSQPVAKLSKFLNDFGLKPIGAIKAGGAYNHMAFVDKKAFQAAAIKTSEEFDLTYKAAPQLPTPKGFAHQPPLKDVVPNATDLFTFHAEKGLPGGTGFFIGGSAVEGQSVKVQKYEDRYGKPYHLFSFKLRESTWKDLPVYQGNGGKFQVPLAQYNPVSGAMVEQGQTKDLYGTMVPAGNQHVMSIPVSSWVSPEGEVHVSTSMGAYGTRGMVLVKVPENPDKSPRDTLHELLGKLSPGLPGKVMSAPTQAETEEMGARRLLWAVAPQAADSMGGSTLGQVKEKLAGLGYGAKALAALRTVSVTAGYHTHVLPGRYKKIADGKVRYLFNGIANGVEGAFNVLRYGLLSINERALHGIQVAGGSVSEDIASGSSDSTLTRLVTDDAINGGAGGWKFAAHNFAGDFQVVISPEELDRLDAYGYKGDHYGKCRSDDSGWVNRSPLETTFGSGHTQLDFEIGFRKGVSSGRFLRVVTGSESRRSSLIERCKKAGIQEFNGVPIDDFIVVCYTVGDCYNKYVKPHGF